MIQKLIIRGNFTIEGDVPDNVTKKLKFLELEANYQTPIRMMSFSSERDLKSSHKTKEENWEQPVTNCPLKDTIAKPKIKVSGSYKKAKNGLNKIRTAFNGKGSEE